MAKPTRVSGCAPPGGRSRAHEAAHRRHDTGHDLTTAHGPCATSTSAGGIMRRGRPMAPTGLPFGRDTSQTTGSARPICRSTPSCSPAATATASAARLPKQFVRLAGDPILLRTLRRLGAARLDRMVVVSHPGLARARRATWSRRRPSASRRRRGRRRHPQREHAQRPRRPGRRRRRHRGCARCGAAAAAARGDPAHDRADRVGPRGRHGHGDPECRHAGDRRRRERGRDPRPRALPPGTDAADRSGSGCSSEAYAAAEHAGDLSATDDCSLVLRYVPEATDACGCRRRDQHEDHDPHRHGDGRPRAPDARPGPRRTAPCDWLARPAPDCTWSVGTTGIGQAIAAQGGAARRSCGGRWHVHRT